MWSTAVVLAALLLQSGNHEAEGIKALEEQRYEAAVQSFTKLIEATPKDYSAHFHLALAQSLLNRDEAAITSYKETLRLRPDLYEAQLNLGIVLLRQKQAAEAAKYLQAAVERKPKEFRPNLYAAEALSQAGEIKPSEPLYRAALEIDPKSALAEAGLARVLAQLGDLDQSASHYARASELDPSYADAVLELASFYEKANRSKDAISIYSRFPENPRAKERLGELLLESGAAKDAIVHLETAVAAEPTAANRYALAMAYISTKDYPKAESQLQAAVAAEPDNNNLRMQYARVLREQKKFAPAAQEFYAVAQKKPDFVEAWGDLAGMLILLEKWEPALGALDRVRALGGEKTAHHYFRALIFDKNKAYPQALESYQKFLSTSEGKNPDEEFKARQRIRVIEKEVKR